MAPFDGTASGLATASRQATRFDAVLVGGGLQSCLIALALLARAGRNRVALVEREVALAGNHTWCFGDGDLPAAARPFVAPLVVHRWSGYAVRFPGHTRRIPTGYSAMTSARVAAVTRAALERRPGCRLVLGRAAVAIEPHAVELEGGERLHAPLVVDARGPSAHGLRGRAGFQKFLGLELELDEPHRQDEPTLIDARVAQLGGFRFFYTLPLGPRRLLIEDTRFSRDPLLDLEAARREILEYAGRRGLRGARITREERGVLPMPWTGRPAAPTGSPLVAGYRGGWFHPATGYSFPVAIRLACHLAARPPEQAFDRGLRRLFGRHLDQVRYCQRLNRMLFHLFAAEDMRNVYERFYRLPAPLIERFYALDLSAADRARILIGRPPRGISLAPRRAQRSG